MKRMLVTGANGFVGAPLVAHLASNNYRIVAVTRHAPALQVHKNVEYRTVNNFEQQPDWLPLLSGVDTVIHLAGRAHVMREGPEDPLVIARRTNVAPTLKLYEACRHAGVARFVYVSSVHVLGTRSGDRPFTETDLPAPEDAYAQSKWEAECGLRELSPRGPQLVVTRPAIVCGPNAKGNFARLIRLVTRGFPLPFGAVTSQRNFVGIRNLCDLLERCAIHPEAPGHTFLAADPETLSLPVLIKILATALDKRVRLLAVPPPLLLALGTLAGQRAQLRRLTDSLCVDASLARKLLGWTNQTALVDELAAMAIAAADAK